MNGTMHRRSWIILSLGLLAIVVSVITLAILPHIVKRIASTQIRAATGRLPDYEWLEQRARETGNATLTWPAWIDRPMPVPPP